MISKAVEMIGLVNEVMLGKEFCSSRITEWPLYCVCYLNFCLDINDKMCVKTRQCQLIFLLYVYCSWDEDITCQQYPWGTWAGVYGLRRLGVNNTGELLQSQLSLVWRDLHFTSIFCYQLSRLSLHKTTIIIRNYDNIVFTF